MDALQILVAARELISDQKNWVRQTMATDKRGFVAGVLSPEACRWCAYGATYRVSGSVCYEDGEPIAKAHKLLTDAGVELFGQTPSRVNDGLGHAATLQMFDKAIELAKGEV